MPTSTPATMPAVSPIATIAITIATRITIAATSAPLSSRAQPMSAPQRPRPRAQICRNVRRSPSEALATSIAMTPWRMALTITESAAVRRAESRTTAPVPIAMASASSGAARAMRSVPSRVTTVTTAPARKVTSVVRPTPTPKTGRGLRRSTRKVVPKTVPKSSGRRGNSRARWRRPPEGWRRAAGVTDCP